MYSVASSMKHHAIVTALSMTRGTNAFLREHPVFTLDEFKVMQAALVATVLLVRRRSNLKACCQRLRGCWVRLRGV